MANPDRWDRISIPEFQDLAQRFGTPFFLYSADEICRRIDLVRESMGKLVEIFYAVKANPNIELLKRIRTSADGLDVSSEGELEQGFMAGFNMANVSFAGPAKTVNELRLAIQRGAGFISIESLRELKECIEISSAIGIKANIGIRINPPSVNRSFGIKMGGRPMQFGIDEEDLNPALELIHNNLAHLDFRGIHIYEGSQCFETGGIMESVLNCLRITRQIESQTGLCCRTINFGGGFGVSHGENNHELDVNALAKELIPTLREFQSSSQVKRQFVFELGRFLTAEAGIYVSQVVSAKQSRGKTFVIVNGGLHHHLSAAGTFGTALRSNFALRNISRPNAPKIRCNIAGPSCNPTDLLGIDVELSQPEQGDLIAVLKSGSYGFTASPLLFLGRRTPVEIIRHRGETFLGRPSRTILDFN